MITYEDIKKANESIKTTDIKGKEYAEVNQRIKAFRMVYPTGAIMTELLSNENGVCVIRATVGYTSECGNITVLGVGTAYEKENSTFINKTSYIENCETSAVGRALGMAGFGIDTSVASAEEVQTAIINQNSDKKVTATNLKEIAKKLKDEKVSDKYVCELYGVAALSELTEAKAENILNNWDRLKAKYNERNNC